MRCQINSRTQVQGSETRNPSGSIDGRHGLSAACPRLFQMVGAKQAAPIGSVPPRVHCQPPHVVWDEAVGCSIGDLLQWRALCRRGTATCLFWRSLHSAVSGFPLILPRPWYPVHQVHPADNQDGPHGQRRIQRLVQDQNSQQNRAHRNDVDEHPRS